ncbi:MAG: sensor domain-containing protein [Chitinivibrionia bacterium]|nr:sensor domain-containing protein [Chitinivibrionia bacterium]
MNNGIEGYLAQLKKELGGSDAAVVQDALSDAEEHLRSALDQALAQNPGMSRADALANVLEEYGSPAEVAAGYKELETRFTPSLAPAVQKNGRSAAVRFFTAVADPRAYGALIYMLFSLISGIIYFTWAVTGLSLTLGFAVLIIGVPFLVLFLLSVQGIALVEGRIVEALLGVRMPRRPIASKKHLGFWGWLKALFKDKRSWTAIIYMILMLPLGTIYFTIFITMIAFGLWGISHPFWQHYLGFPVAEFGESEIFTPGWLSPLVVLVGVLWIFVTMNAAKGLGRMHGSIAKALLVKE